MCRHLRLDGRVVVGEQQSRRPLDNICVGGLDSIYVSRQAREQPELLLPPVQYAASWVDARLVQSATARPLLSQLLVEPLTIFIVLGCCPIRIVPPFQAASKVPLQSSVKIL